MRAFITLSSHASSGMAEYMLSVSITLNFPALSLSNSLRNSFSQNENNKHNKSFAETLKVFETK